MQGTTTEDELILGTVNVVLANAHGVVVLTDSKGSVFDSAGRRVDSKEVQKLIRLDDHSVCVIAGFGSGSFSAGLQFNADAIAIISEFRDQLAAKKGKLSFEEKLRSLAFLIERYIQSYANIREVFQPGLLTEQRLYFSLFLVGIDSDGKMKVGKLEIKAIRRALPNDGTSWEFSESPDVKPVPNKLIYGLGGMWDVGQKIMRDPASYSRNPAVQMYSRAAAADSGASLQLADLKALAHFIGVETAKAHPDDVGGPDQIAVFRKDGTVTIEQRQFPEPEKPMPIAVITSQTGAVLSFGPGGAIVAPRGTAIIWVRNTIVGYQGLLLDGNFFIGNEIRDCSVYYQGGPTVFDPSNKVINSTLQLDGFNAIAKYLAHSFPWKRCLPFSCGTT